MNDDPDVTVWNGADVGRAELLGRDLYDASQALRQATRQDGDAEATFYEQPQRLELHPRIKAAAREAPVVVKEFADSFVGTALEETLSNLGVTELLVCGMMTQNCVTHTAISKSAEKYEVTILPDACTTVSEMLHRIALHAVSTRVKLAPSTDAL